MPYAIIARAVYKARLAMQRTTITDDILRHIEEVIR